MVEVVGLLMVQILWHYLELSFPCFCKVTSHVLSLFVFQFKLELFIRTFYIPIAFWINQYNVDFDTLESMIYRELEGVVVRKWWHSKKGSM